MPQATTRITRVQVDELDPGPLPAPFVDSTMGPFTHWKVAWLRLTSDDGVVGQAPTGINEAAAQALLRDGELPLDRWWHKLWWMHRNQGHRNPATSNMIFGVDLAMRDILAQRAGQPLHRYLGASRDRVPVYGSGGGTNRPLDELIAELRDMVASGFRVLKMKVGADFGTRPDEDVERVRAVRRALGPDVGLAVDGNQTWTAAQAQRFAERIADQRIEWFEEPVHSADRAAMRELCRSCPFPVAMGESENHWLGFRDMAECGVPHLQPSPHGLPGFDRWRDAVGYAEAQAHAHNVTWSAGGFTHVTAVYVATRPAGIVEYLRPIIGHLATCMAAKPEIRDGHIDLPSTPGLPMRVDWDGLAIRGAVRSVLDLKSGV